MTLRTQGTYREHQGDHREEFCGDHNKLRHGRYTKIFQSWGEYRDSHQIYRPYLTVHEHVLQMTHIKIIF